MKLLLRGLVMSGTPVACEVGCGPDYPTTPDIGEIERILSSTSFSGEFDFEDLRPMLDSLESGGPFSLFSVADWRNAFPAEALDLIEQSLLIFDPDFQRAVVANLDQFDPNAYPGGPAQWSTDRNFSQDLANGILTPDQQVTAVSFLEARSYLIGRLGFPTLGAIEDAEAGLGPAARVLRDTFEVLIDDPDLRPDIIEQPLGQPDAIQIALQDFEVDQSGNYVLPDGTTGSGGLSGALDDLKLLVKGVLKHGITTAINIATDVPTDQIKGVDDYGKKTRDDFQDFIDEKIDDDTFFERAKDNIQNLLADVIPVVGERFRPENTHLLIQQSTVGIDFNIGLPEMTYDGHTEHFIGIFGADKMAFGSGNDVASGGLGADRLSGGGGHDALSGGAGRDKLFGGTGNDLIFGGAQSDRLDGGKGRDRLMGENGGDRIDGGQGRDRIEGGKGRDRIEGNQGRDRLEGGQGSDVLEGGGGPDTFVFDMRDKTGFDRILDFDPGIDRLLMQNGDRFPARIGETDDGDALIRFDNGGGVVLVDVDPLDIVVRGDAIL